MERKGEWGSSRQLERGVSEERPQQAREVGERILHLLILLNQSGLQM